MRRAILTLAAVSFTVAAIPSAEASKLSKWIDNHAVPRLPSANRINGAADQANKTAAATKEAVDNLSPKIATLAGTLTWGSGAVLGLLSILLLGKTVGVWRQACAGHIPPR